MSPVIDPETEAAPVRIGETRMLIRGIVEHGDHRGREIGFPTANVSVGAHSIAPPEGVYAGFVHLSGAVQRAAISIGRRPTFYEERGLRLVEAHLLDFDGDLYDEMITVELVQHLRDQVRFNGLDELVAQLRIDVDRSAAALAVLRSTSLGPSATGP